MFESYLFDSHKFLELAENASDIDSSKRFFRASIFHSAGAIEAYINYLGFSFSDSDLPPIENAFLNDKILIFDKGELKERNEYHRTDEKLRVIMKRFHPRFDYQSSDWSSLMAFKKFRDSLLHPRISEDDIDVKRYRKMAKSGLTSVISIMNTISRRTFRRPLRKKLLDLIPN